MIGLKVEINYLFMFKDLLIFQPMHGKWLIVMVQEHWFWFDMFNMLYDLIFKKIFRFHPIFPKMQNWIWIYEVWIILPIGSHHSKPWTVQIRMGFWHLCFFFHGTIPFKKARDLKFCRIAIRYSVYHVFWHSKKSILIANKKPLDPKTHEKMTVLHLPKYRWNPPIGNIYHLYTIDNKLPNTWDPHHWINHWPSPRVSSLPGWLPSAFSYRCLGFGMDKFQGKTRI